MLMTGLHTQGKKKTKRIINFEPQPGPQSWLLSCPVNDVFFGGARGGGKTYGLLGHFLAKASLNAGKGGVGHFRGLLIRRTYPELEDVIFNAKNVYRGLGEWKQQAKMFVFNDKGPYRGATLRFSYLDKDKDADRYQGHAYQWIGIEEAGNFATPYAIDLLRATLRSGTGSQTYLVMTGNPGGVGHNWLKAEYVAPGVPNEPFTIEIKNPTTGTVTRTTRIFIPSRLEDNRALIKHDPQYKERIINATAGKPWLLKAWLEGDWNIISGGAWDDVWNEEKHVMRPFAVPDSWNVYRSFDWGSSRPFSVGWWAVSDGTRVQLPEGNMVFPAGTLIRIHEWYGCTGKPDEGLRLVDSDVAKEIKRIEIETNLLKNRIVQPGPADPMIFNIRPDRRSIHDSYVEHGIMFVPGHNEPGSRVPRWQRFRHLLKAAADSDPEKPGLYVFETCRDFIRTIPVMQRCKRNPDDVDTDSEDHIADESGYMVMHLPNKVHFARMQGI